MSDEHYSDGFGTPHIVNGHCECLCNKCFNYDATEVGAYCFCKKCNGQCSDPHSQRWIDG